MKTNEKRMKATWNTKVDRKINHWQNCNRNENDELPPKNQIIREIDKSIKKDSGDKLVKLDVGAST